MKRLLSYASVIYDAQCLVYYCLDFSENINGKAVVLTSPESELIQNITRNLIEKGKRVVVSEHNYQEISRSRLTASIVKDFVEKGTIRATLGLKTGETTSSAVYLSLTRKLDKKIRGLQGKPWFTIDSFMADPNAMQAVRDFYNSFRQDARMVNLLQKKKRTVCYPSDRDINLLLFSRDNKLPVITNDHDFIDFKADLETASLCHKIIPFKEITPD